MRPIYDMIQSLDDGSAGRALSIFARAQLRRRGYETEWHPEMREALLGALQVDPGVAPAPSEGELARQALLVLVDDPQHREAICAIIQSPPPEKLGILEAAAAVTAVLVVLQTHVKFERDKDGRLSLKIEKKPASEGLLKSLVEKLLAFMGGGRMTRP